MSLRSIGSTGSPLPPEVYPYVYKHIREDLWLCSMSGGTDVCTAWVGSCPWKPVLDGEIQCSCLGVNMQAYDEEGRSLNTEVGEMVATTPLPCRPVSFRKDPDYTRYRASNLGYYHGGGAECTELQNQPPGGAGVVGPSTRTH